MPLIEEAAVPARPGFILPAKDHARVHAFYAKICKISIENGPSGSAFLIGPDLLMTADHVIAQCSKERFAQRRVRFSFLDDTLENELVLCEVLISELNIVARGYRQDDNLDYCVLRLPSRVGLTQFFRGLLSRRGWFKILAETTNATRQNHIILLHFPSDRGGSGPIPVMSPGTISDYSDDRSVAFHDARTALGSSGAICIYQPDLVPAFLHTGHDGAGRNKAISLSHILADIRQNYHELINELNDQSYSDVYPRLTALRDPIVNRDQFLEKVFKMANGADLVPIYAIGERQFGRTFLSTVIKTISPHAPFFFVDFASRDYKDRASFAAGLNSDLPRDYQFDVTRSTTEREAAWFRWFVDQLLFQLSKYTTDSKHLLSWVFVDSIDYHIDFILDFLGHAVLGGRRYTNLRLCFAGSIRPNIAGLDFISLSTFSDGDIRRLVLDFGAYTSKVWSIPELETVVRTFLDATRFATLPFLEQVDQAKNILRFLEGPAGA